tara:strand:- start:4994 stop:5101 length:108 start_codon:yes stop_codon:yes gene_type:complete
MINWIKKKYKDWKMERLYKKRIKELKKRDPFVYKK